MVQLDPDSRLVIENILRQNINLSTLQENNNNNEKQTYAFLQDLMGWQKEIVEEKHRFKALLCSRRAGKSFLLVYALLIAAFRKPGSICLFIARSRRNAKRLIWEHLKTIISNYSIDADFNNTELTVKLQNGSQIQLHGAENEGQVAKLRGDKYSIAVIDEAAFFPVKLMHEMMLALEPALEDLQGDIYLSSSPNLTASGYFYDVTTQDKGFKTYKKTILDNSKFDLWKDKSNWKERAQHFLEALKKRKKWDNDNPIFLTEWMGQWVRDETFLVIPYKDEVNLYERLPVDSIYDRNWKTIIGLDMGFKHKFALGVIKLNKYLPTIYIHDAFSKEELTTNQKMEIVKQYKDKYKPDSIVCDPGGGGAQFIADLNDKYPEVYIQNAQKGNKKEHLELFADDWRTGTLKINEVLTEHIEELKSLQWKDEKRETINESCSDDLYHGCLYAWRECLSYPRGREKPQKPIDRETQIDKWEQEMEEYLEDQLIQEEEDNELFG